jgi:hypothetical protein
VGLIHLLVSPEDYGFAACLGLLMIANFFAGSVVQRLGFTGTGVGLDARRCDVRWRFPLGTSRAGGWEYRDCHHRSRLVSRQVFSLCL